MGKTRLSSLFTKPELNVLHHGMQPKDHNLSFREISERAKHTPLPPERRRTSPSPLPNTLVTLVIAQRGLSVHVNNKGSAICTKRPLSCKSTWAVRGSTDSGSRLFDLVEQTSLDKVGSPTRSDERSEASEL